MIKKIIIKGLPYRCEMSDVRFTGLKTDSNIGAKISGHFLGVMMMTTEGLQSYRERVDGYKA